MLQINGNITQLIKLADIFKPMWIKSRRQNKFRPVVCFRLYLKSILVENILNSLKKPLLSKDSVYMFTEQSTCS